jgi:hypothetical protein
MAVIEIAELFFRSGKPKNPPCPPLKNGEETTRNCYKNPLLKKGDLGEVENLQVERIHGKRHKPP